MSTAYLMLSVGHSATRKGCFFLACDLMTEWPTWLTNRPTNSQTDCTDVRTDRQNGRTDGFFMHHFMRCRPKKTSLGGRQSALLTVCAVKHSVVESACLEHIATKLIALWGTMLLRVLVYANIARVALGSTIWDDLNIVFGKHLTSTFHTSTTFAEVLKRSSAVQAADGFTVACATYMNGHNLGEKTLYLVFRNDCLSERTYFLFLWQRSCKDMASIFLSKSILS
jgi:hypothetical protein